MWPFYCGHWQTRSGRTLLPTLRTIGSARHVQAHLRCEARRPSHGCGAANILKVTVDHGLYNNFHRARFEPPTHCAHFIGETVMARVLFLMLLFTLAFSSRASQPQINVGPLFDYLQPGSSTLLKRIRNTGSATAYVRVEVTRMQFDDAGKVSETPVDTAALARNASDAQGIIASPSRLIIAADGQQATRLVHRGARDEEHYYRLRFIPVAPSAEEFSLSEAQAAEAVAVTSAIQVFTGYGTILFVAPETARYETRIDSNQIQNHGNATVVLDNLRQCERANPDACAPGVIVHIRPGQVHALDTPDTHFQRYELREGDRRRSIDSRR
ncbi:CS1 fimbrial subunit B flags: Precursor [Stenotrophomonas lactitubi]|uniref:CS1 fimbrial subunit B flags: Precursor n=1 Tax=Stenotrophomonas lactitubi TaxID=2045214 RepID=UPI0032088198